mgnify:CR=1 FL=1
MASLVSCLNTKLSTRCRCRSQRGTVALEMALLSPVFFLFLIGTVEVMLIETAQAVMESATFAASRLAKTGFTNNGQTQAQSVNAVLNTQLQSFGAMIDITKVTVTSTAYTSFSSSGTGNGGVTGYGAPQQVVVYDVAYPWKIFTPMLGHVLGSQNAQGDWVMNLRSHIVVRDEPY